MGDAMREKVARAMFRQDHDEGWDQGEDRTKVIYLNNTAAALKACHFEELCRTLRSIEGFPKAAEQTGHSGDFLRGLELPADYARAVLAKVKDTSDA